MSRPILGVVSVFELEPGARHAAVKQTALIGHSTP
jgi:hypothetical protein